MNNFGLIIETRVAPEKADTLTALSQYLYKSNNERGLVMGIERNKLPSQSVLLEHFKYNAYTGDLVRIKHSGTRTDRVGNVMSKREPKGYIVVYFLSKTYKAHRLIWKMLYDDEPVCIDHINGVKDDNRLINLRKLSIRGNNINRHKLSVNNTSGITGVYWCEQAQRWRAKVKDKQGKSIIRSSPCKAVAGIKRMNLVNELYKGEI